MPVARTTAETFKSVLSFPLFMDTVYSSGPPFTPVSSVWVRMETPFCCRISETLLSTTQAKHLLQASEALQQKEADSPPRENSLSMRVVGIPFRDNSVATVITE